MPTYEFECKRCQSTTIYSSRDEETDVSDFVCPGCEMPELQLVNFDAVENLSLTKIIYDLEELHERMAKLEDEYGVEEPPSETKGH